jgi:hypothetical protein
MPRGASIFEFLMFVGTSYNIDRRRIINVVATALLAFDRLITRENLP